ncbi:hypothetical protein PGT21_033417 [Puccinia graminis f. sp. tritici]|uniref:Uncharacterized protein n=1 Tax=Puccinia graminis f. sp. tritici TaxID=56615 RepID=A0A5B0MWH1_PUCGR|nr:hypothetical protein PGT21_033417 [Puccinia graminis f. sp. tritici]KAA1130254.1 hypothetical protein PGTUg99_018172 [Puccinia graminis f. sp. tritici]
MVTITPSPTSTPPLTGEKGRSKSKSKRTAVTTTPDLDDDDSSGESDANKAPKQTYKRVRETKNNVIGNGIQGLISAIEKALEGSSNLMGVVASIAGRADPNIVGSTSSGPTSLMDSTQSATEDAIDKLHDMFMLKLPVFKFVAYVRLIEDQSKAQMFLKLAHTTTEAICESWLETEA